MCLKASQPLGLQGVGVFRPMVPAVPLSVWSVSELVRTSELRHRVNLLVD